MEQIFSTPAFKEVIKCYSRDNRAPDAKSCLEKYLKSQNTTELGQQDAHNELNESYASLWDKFTQMDNTVQSIDRVFVQLFSITTSLCNDILGGSASEGSVKKAISNFEQLLASEDIEIYYFERGAVYSAVDDSSKAQLQLVPTEKQDLDSTVCRCNCIGYNIKKLEIRRPAKVSLYKFNDNPVETNEDQHKDESKTNSDQNLTDSLKDPICGDSKQ